MEIIERRLISQNQNHKAMFDRSGLVIEGVDGNWDHSDARALYGILEKEVIPIYYKVSDDGIPHEWVKVMKKSIKNNAPRFSARLMVKSYIENFYVKAL